MRYLSIATVIAGISGFVVITIAARAFGDDTVMAEEFAAYWGLFFGVTGVLTGLTQETTRSVAAAQEHITANPAASDATVAGTATPSMATPAPEGVLAMSTKPQSVACPFVIGLWIALAAFIVVVASSPLWATEIVHDDTILAVGLMAVGLASCAIQATVTGVISGLGLWSRYAALITLDTASRMVVAIIAWVAGWKLVAFLIITVLGAGSWLVLVAGSTQVRRALFSRADIPCKQFLTQSGYAMLASGATAILITSFPTIVKFTHSGTEVPVSGATTATISASAIIYGVIFTRAPILVPLQQFLSALIVRFVATRSHPYRMLAAPLGFVWVVGLIGAAGAYLIGPWLMVTILGPAYYLTGPQLFLLTLGATCTASIMITGAAVVAKNKHRAYLWGWILATIVAISLMATIDNLATASWLALTLGPLSGLVIHMTALRK